MKTAKVDTLAWVAVYVGMALVGLGISLRHGDPGLGWGVAMAGGLGVCAGVVLIWLRSRMSDGA